MRSFGSKISPFFFGKLFEWRRKKPGLGGEKKTKTKERTWRPMGGTYRLPSLTTEHGYGLTSLFFYPAGFSLVKKTHLRTFSDVPRLLLLLFIYTFYLVCLQPYTDPGAHTGEQP